MASDFVVQELEEEVTKSDGAPTCLRLEAKKFSKGDFAPLTPEILRKAAANISFCMGMCTAVAWNLDPDPDPEPWHESFKESAKAALKRLYCAFEGQPWDLDVQSYLVRFGGVRSFGGQRSRQECLLRMADWLDSLDG